MKYYNAKDEKLFYLAGCNAINPNGFYRLSEEELRIMEPLNDVASSLGKNSAGMQLRFKTNSKNIKVKIKLAGPSSFNHMSSIGQSGLDLYVFDEKSNEYIFLKSTNYDKKLTEFEYELISFKETKSRDFILNLSLYNTLVNLEVGLDMNSETIPYKFSNNDNVVMYGSSILQGGVVSRPGMMYSNVISRKIDNQIYNFGFSGSAFCEKEMALIIAKVKNPKVLIIDAQPNAGIDDRLINNLPTFVETYRNVHPKTPILVASRIRYAMDNYDEEIINQDNKNRKFMEDFVEKQNITDKNIYYVDGHEVFKDNFSEATVDGTHPNDYGSIQLADFYLNEIKKYL